MTNGTAVRTDPSSSAEEGRSAPIELWRERVRRRLNPPATPQDVCPRDQVLHALTAPWSGRLSLLIAPPGFGKTTVLSQLATSLRRQGAAVAWLTARGEERDPKAFLTTLSAALNEAGVAIDPASNARGPGRRDDLPDRILASLEAAGGPVTVIIDDLDRAASPALLRVLDSLIEDLPKEAQLVFGCRRRPALRVSALCAQGQARILGPEELRLGEREIAQVLGRDASQAELQWLSRLTEGWPVAVRLYRTWRIRAGAGKPAPRFGGAGDELGVYLAEQVLCDLSIDQRDLLASLALIEVADPALVDHIRGRRDSDARLEELASALPGLLVRLEGPTGDPAYRLHPLLASYAEERQALSPRRRADDHAKAAEWLWGRRRYREWIRQALASGDEAGLRERLANLPYMEIFLASGAGDLRAILRETPPTLAKASPRLQLAAILTHFKGGFFIEARRMLGEHRARLGEATCPGLSIEIAALDLLFEIYLEGGRSDADRRMEALRQSASSDPIIWAWCDNLLAVMNLDRGDLSAARKASRRCAAAYSACGALTFAELHLTILDMELCLAKGDLKTALALVNSMTRRRPGRRPGVSGVSSLTRIVQAVVQYERTYRLRWADDLKTALEGFSDGGAGFDPYAASYPILVDAALRREGPAAALAEIARLRIQAARRGTRSLNGMLTSLEELACLRAQERARDAVCLEPRAPWRERDVTVRVAALQALRRGEPERAAELARRMAVEGRASGRTRTEIKGRVLEAMALDLVGQPAAAEASLRAAMQMALPSGMVAVFAEEGLALRPLLERVAQDLPAGLEQRLCIAALTAIEPERGGEPSLLSVREAEILAHLAEGASNKLIARRLGLSSNTVKFHLKRAYAKLGVSTRRTAVAKVFLQR